MAVLTQDQLKKLRESGLNDNEISSLAQKNGFTLPTTTPSRILSTNEVFSLKKQGLNDTEISTLAQKNNIGLPEQNQDGFFKSTLKDVAKTLLVKPAIRTAQALAAVPVYTFGSDATKQRYQEQIAKDVKVPFTGITVEGQRKFGEGGATQIASDTLKSASYLYGGQGATKAVGGLAKGAIARPIATGAFTGAVGGATYGAGEEMTNPEATIGSTLKAGAVGGVAGGVLGAAIPAVGSAIKPTYKIVKDATGKTKMLFASPQDKALYIVNKRQGELSNLVNKSSPLKKLVSSAQANGYDPIKDLSDSDLLVGAVNKDGRIDGKLVQERFNEVMDVPEGIIKKKFEDTGEQISLDRVQQRMAEVLNSDYVPSKIYKQVQNKYDDIVYGLYQKGKVLTDDGKVLAQDMTYIDDAGNKVPYLKSPLIKFADLQQEKIDAYKLSNFLDPEKTLGDKAIGRAFKVAIDQDSKSIPELEQINKELGRYLSVKSLIDKLDEKVVKGGRLGKYFAQGIGAIAGQSVGGPLGGIVGAEVGGKIQGQILKGTFGKAVGKDIFEGSLETLKNQSNKVDALQIPQANTINATKNVISKSIAPNKKSSQAGFISTGSKDLQPLYKEAQKYKSAEEFVKAQGKPMYHGTREKWSGDFKEPVKGEYGSEAIFVAPSESTASYYDRGGGIKETYINPNAKIWNYNLPENQRIIEGIKKDPTFVKYIKDNWNLSLNEVVRKINRGEYEWVQRPEVLDYLRKKGFDGFINRDYGGGETIGIFSNKNIKTKSQLEQIWKEANSKTSTKQGMTAVNPLTVGAGVSAVGAGAMSIKNKKK